MHLLTSILVLNVDSYLTFPLNLVAKFYDLTSEAMSNSGPPVSNPLGKRGACERCRGQKLRCIREDQNQTSPRAACIRCYKAGATCSYGTAKRAGRSPASNTSSPQERRGNGGGRTKIGGTASRSTVNTSGPKDFFPSEVGTWQDLRATAERDSGQLLKEYTVDQESEGEPETLSASSLHDTSNVLTGAHIDSLASSTSSTANFPWLDETMPPFSNRDAEEASGLESCDSKYSWTFHNYRAQPMAVQGPTISVNSDCEQPGNGGINAYGYAQSCLTDTQISGVSSEAMDLDLLTTSAQTASFNPTDDLDARSRRIQDGNGEWAQLSENSGSSSSLTANPALFEDLARTEAGIKLGTKSLSVNEIQHQRIQELSKLATDLYAQLATNDPDNHQPTSGTTATFEDQLAGSVLESSNRFLTLLGSFSTPANSSSTSPPSPPASSMDYNNSNGYSRDITTSPSVSAQDADDHAMNEPAQSSHVKLLAGSSEDSKLPPQIDMATVLQLLTCYIRIVHLHSIMHARILDYMFAFLQHNGQHVDPVPPVFPNMQVGGVSLNRFGTFQVILLLQISMHVLGEIESALGLPREFRVGKSKGGRTGVLGASVSGDFVKCLMSEGAWRGKKVECVREQLGNLRRVLKKAVDL